MLAALDGGGDMTLHGDTLKNAIGQTRDKWGGSSVWACCC